MSESIDQTFEAIIASMSNDQAVADGEAGAIKITSQMKELVAQLSTIQNQISEFQTTLKDVDVAQDNIKGEIKEHQDAVQKLRAKSHELERDNAKIRRSLRDAERNVKSVTQKLNNEMEKQKIQDAYTLLSDTFDKLTAGAPWREFAFNHQIEGAKRLAAIAKYDPSNLPSSRSGLPPVPGSRGILADKRGLGKSLTSLIWADMLEAKKVVVMTPAGEAMNNFANEIQHWAPHRKVIVLGGLPKDQRDMLVDILKTFEDFVIVINYQAWRKDKTLIPKLRALKPDALIVDEAHNAKDRKTLVFKGINQLLYTPNHCPTCGGADIGTQWSMNRDEGHVCNSCGNLGALEKFCSVKHVLPMTGTPILNRPQDLFTLLKMIDRNQFNSENDFLFAYCQQDYFTKKWKFQKGGLDRLTARLSHRFIKRDRQSAGVTIPPQTIQVHQLNFNHDKYPEQSRVLRALNEQAMIALNATEGIAVSAIIALITRKRQAITWPAGIQFKDQDGNVVLSVDAHESVKVDALVHRLPYGETPNLEDCAQEVERDANSGFETKCGLIPELIAEDERIVVFSQFKAPLHEIHSRLQQWGITSVILDGDTPALVREAIRKDFDAKYHDSLYEPKWQVVLANYKVAGEALNFTAASQMIILDEEWNPAKNEQAYGRIDRLGQEKSTQVHIFRVANSIDNWMANLNEEKAKMVDGFEVAIDLQQMFTDGLEGGML